MLAAWRQLREQVAIFDKAVRALAKADPTCRLLMSVPGIGVLSVLAHVSTVGDPECFARSRSAGAHMGLAPRQHQSGEVDRSGRISKCGDTPARTLLHEAAVVILARVKRASRLKEGAQAIAKRSGPGQARVALARKLSVILHSIWRSGEPFRWSEQELAQAAQRDDRDPSGRQRGCEGCPPGRGCRLAAREAVGPCAVHASPLWTLQRLCFGPDVAAAYADRGENHDPGTATTPAASKKQLTEEARLDAVFRIPARAVLQPGACMRPGVSISVEKFPGNSVQ